MYYKTGMIYILKNTRNGKCYVGQTIVKINRRLKNHKTSPNAIGNAIRKYGIEKFEILEYRGIPYELLDFFEIQMIEKIGSIAPTGYNLVGGGQKYRQLGPLSEDTKRKIGKAHIGRKHRSESIEKMRQSKMGHLVTKEQRRKMSVAQKKIWASMTPEERESRSIATKRKELKKSPEGRARLRKAYENRTAWNKGKTLSDEHRKNLSLSHMGNESGHKGHPHSEASKQKMRESRKRYLQRKAEESA